MPVALKIVFYGTYRLITDRESIEVALPAGNTLLDVLREIIVLYPILGEALFDEAGNLFPYIPLFLNGRNPRLLEQGMHTYVTQGDVLSIFSPIASGRLNVEDLNQSTAGPFPEERLR
jgi:molybdopterin converting factor small subunit